MSANVKINKNGLVDDGVYGYELESEHSWLSFGRDTSRNLFIFYMIGTTERERNKGHAKKLLDIFFKIVKRANAMICLESYTSAGSLYIKHVIERMANEYGVKVVNTC